MTDKKRNKVSLTNAVWIVVLILLIVPQSRVWIQVKFHGLLSQVNTVRINPEEDRPKLIDCDWNLIDEDGNIINFKTHKDKVVFINFWATWCPPCIAEMQSLDELAKAYDSQIPFLFITTDNLDVVNDFKDKKGYSFRAYNLVDGIPADINPQSIPRTVILDKKGEIVVDKTGALQWDSPKVRQLLNHLLKE